MIQDVMIAPFSLAKPGLIPIENLLPMNANDITSTEPSSKTEFVNFA